MNELVIATSNMNQKMYLYILRLIRVTESDSNEDESSQESVDTSASSDE